MQYNTLKARIVADIYANGNEEITGSILQGDLLAMVNSWASAGAMYGGVITPASAAPADLNQATVYLALTAGTYTNFVDGGGNPIVTTGPALITYDGGASLVFSKTDLPAGGGGSNYVTITSSTTDVVIPGDQSDRDAINLLISYAYDNNGSTTYYLGILSFATSDLHDQTPLLQTLRTDSGGEIGSWLVGVISGSGEVFIQPNDINSGDVEVNIYDLDGVQLEVRQSGDADYPTASDFNDVELSEEDRICDSVKFSSQTLSAAQKLQARTNIGATAPEVFVAEYGVTTAADIESAISAGKIVVCFYNSACYTFGRLETNYIYLSTTRQERYYNIAIHRTNNTWQTLSATFELSSNKVSTISGNETDTTKYPNTKAVADALGKMGVISQTLTWNSTNNTYSASGQVTGLISKEFIDTVVSAGASFDESTGYFALNGITNIALDEMREMWNKRVGYGTNSVLSIYGSGYTARTNFYIFRNFGVSFANQQPTTAYLKYLCANNASITKVAFSDSDIFVRADSVNNFTAAGTGSPDFNRSRIEEIIGVINVQNLTGSQNFFYNGAWQPWLHTFYLKKLSASINISGMPALSAASVAYMITNAGTATITITLHATAYARAIADADVQAALQSKTNVSLATA